MRQVDRAGHMALGVKRGAAHIEQHEIDLARSEGRMHIPAIGFEGEFCSEMRFGLGGGAAGMAVTAEGIGGSFGLAPLF